MKYKVKNWSDVVYLANYIQIEFDFYGHIWLVV